MNEIKKEIIFVPIHEIRQINNIYLVITYEIVQYPK